MAELDAIARRLDRVGAWVRPHDDRLLTFLGIIGRSGVGVGLGMIVDGMLVMGAIGPQRLMEEGLWDATSDAIRGSNVSDDMREVLEQTWQTVLEQDKTRQADEERLMDRYDAGVELDDIEVADVYSLYRMASTDVLDLHNVQLYVGAASDPIQVATMRVRLSAVKAWWPLKAQGVNVNYEEAPTD